MSVFATPDVCVCVREQLVEFAGDADQISG